MDEVLSGPPEEPGNRGSPKRSLLQPSSLSRSPHIYFPPASGTGLDWLPALETVPHDGSFMVLAGTSNTSRERNPACKGKENPNITALALSGVLHVKLARDLYVKNQPCKGGLKEKDYRAAKMQSAPSFLSVTVGLNPDAHWRFPVS